MRAPSNSPITMLFGSTAPPYSVGSPHKGVDFAYIPDSTIYAPFAGKVTQIPLNGNDGNGSYMTEPNGRFHGMLHASKYLVANGSSVAEGQPIAIMGDTGYAEGIHLHWAVKQNNQFIDPLSILEGGQGGDMADKITQDVSRVLYSQILGLNGCAGRPTALDGSHDGDSLIGRDLTNELILELYEGATATQWRDVLIPQINQQLATGSGGFVPVTDQLYTKKKK